MSDPACDLMKPWLETMLPPRLNDAPEATWMTAGLAAVTRAYPVAVAFALRVNVVPSGIAAT